MEESALIGHFEEKNLRTLTRFTLDENDRYGHLSLIFDLPDTSSQFIVELIDEKNTQVYHTTLINSPQKIEYKNYLEGKYRVRIIYDSNKNGVWDPGDLKNKIQPEKIWYYTKVFNIRPNWEQEETIQIPPEESPRQILPAVKR